MVVLEETKSEKWKLFVRIVELMALVLIKFPRSVSQMVDCIVVILSAITLLSRCTHFPFVFYITFLDD